MKLGLFASSTLAAVAVVFDASASPLLDLTGGTDGIGGLQVAGEPLPGSRGLQTNNPGWPGFGSQGAIVSAGSYLTVMR